MSALEVEAGLLVMPHVRPRRERNLPVCAAARAFPVKDLPQIRDEQDDDSRGPVEQRRNASMAFISVLCVTKCLVDRSQSLPDAPGYVFDELCGRLYYFQSSSIT